MAKSSFKAHPRFVLALRVLAVMIIGLMALGAGVRTMNAGLSCPDWPLCFGKVIPDFHPGVYFEFIHRAYAGLVALVFFGCCVYVWRVPGVPKAAKVAAGVGLFALLTQIIMGGLTVLLLIKSVVVTSHLMLATIFFVCVLWMLFSVDLTVEKSKTALPLAVRALAWAMPLAVFVQIFIGGFVASTYAGSVCVDWPLCNGQWVPTWQGAIGIQIIHRFVAYALAVALLVIAFYMQINKNASWMSRQLLRLSWVNAFLVFVQVGVGVANLLLYIPPSVTVLHQSVGILLLAVNLRWLFIVRVLAKSQAKGDITGSVGQVSLGVSG